MDANDLRRRAGIINEDAGLSMMVGIALGSALLGASLGSMGTVRFTQFLQKLSKPARDKLLAEIPHYVTDPASAEEFKKRIEPLMGGPFVS